MIEENTVEETFSDPVLLRTAMSVAKVQMSEKLSHFIILVYEGIKKKGGEFSLKDISEIQVWVDNQYDK